MNYHTRYTGISRPVRACLVGGGAFGQSFLAQARFIRRLSATIAVDLTAEAAGRALAAAGFAPADIRLCETPAEARVAHALGKAVAAGSFDTVLDLPFDILVEATGHPEAAATHALKAIESRRHVLMVTKEADSVAGPMLARRAREVGVGLTPVDGDQPALLIDLITWAEELGFDLVGAGKSSEYDFVFDAKSGQVTSNGISALLPGLAPHWAPGARALREVAAARAEVLGSAFPLRAVPDLCELTLVANATGFVPDIAPLHAPVARIPEVAALFGSGGPDSLLTGKRRLDVFHHLRAPDEASFAGGVFVTLVCHDRVSWQVLKDKGHVVSADGASAMVYLPRHLLGIEAATSVLDLAGLGLSTYPEDYAPRIDLVAVATRDLPAGTALDAVGHHHTIAGVTAEMRPVRPLSVDETTPYYLVANRRLARPVARGAAIRPSDLALSGESSLFCLRMAQDSAFSGRWGEE